MAAPEEELADFGREPELARLERALQRASRGHPQVVAIGAEAGLGKTRLLDEFDARFTGEAVAIGRGNCPAICDGDLPYAAVAEAMRGLCMRLDPEALRAAAGRWSSELAPLVPSFSDDAAPGAPGQLARVRLFQLFLDLLGALARHHVVVLEIEDLHWADESSLNLLSFVSRNLRQARILLVITYRPEDLDTVGENDPRLAVMQELLRSSTEHLQLAPLSAPQIRRLLEDYSGEEISEDVARRAFELSGGNPFYAQELLEVAESLSSLDALPDRLRRIVLMRVQRLTEPAQHVVRLLAVAGRPLSHSMVAVASELDERRLLPALREAVTSRVLAVADADDGYTFRHWLTAEAVSLSLLPGERRALHAALAAALEACDTDRSAAHFAQVAYHWERAERRPEALAAAVVAARAALRVNAFDEARRQFQRALALWDRVPDAEAVTGVAAHELLPEAAEACYWSEDAGQAAQLVERAIELARPGGAPERLASLLGRLAMFRWHSDDLADAIAASSDAVELLRTQPDSAEKAAGLAGLSAMLLMAGQVRESRAHAEQALAIARRTGGRLVESRALCMLGLALTKLGEADAGVAAIRSAVAIADGVGDLEAICRAHANLAYALEELGRLDDAWQVTDAGLRRTQELRVGVAGDALFRGNAANLLWRLGRWEEAESLLARPGRDEPDLYTCVLRAQVLVARGDLAAAHEQVDRIRALTGRAMEPDLIEQAHAVTAEIEAWSGRWREAAAAVDSGVALLRDGEDRARVLRLCAIGLRVAGDAGAIARSAGDRDGAARWSAWGDQLLRASETVTGEEGLTPGALVWARLAAAEHARLRGLPAATRFAEIAEDWRALGCPYEEAYACWRQAQCLLSVHPTEECRAALRRAHALASRLGAQLLAARVGALARSLGTSLEDESPASQAQAPAQRPSPAPEPGGGPFDTLTAKEREVLRLVAQGYTNRRIGRALGMSEKTASVHVSRILAKVQVANRTELAALAHLASST